MKQTLVMVLLICLLFTSCSFDSGQDEETNTEESTDINTNNSNRNGESMIEDMNIEKSERKNLNFTVWSFQVPDPNQCRDYALFAKKYGFDGIDFCVTWKYIENEKGVYDWTYLDKCLDIFIEQGMTLSLSLMFWTGDMDWTNNLSFQQTMDGNVYKFDELRGPGLCYNDLINLEIINNSVKEFAKHTYERYSDKIERYHARTSCYGELEYSPVEDLDYSPVAVNAFYEYLANRFDNIEQFNNVYNLNIKSWDDLKETPISNIVNITKFDWKSFKQKTIIELNKGIVQAFKSVAPEIPVAIQIGSMWDHNAADKRGVFDGYLISRDVDVLHIDDGPFYPHYLSIDMASSLASDKLISVEIDGAWQIETFTEKDVAGAYLNQAERCGESGVAYLNTANWDIGQMITWGENLLAKYHDTYYKAYERKIAPSDRAILVNTTDMIANNPSKGLDVFLSDVYNGLSENGKLRVRFISDSMILDNPSILGDLKSGLYLGRYKSIHLNPEVAKILAESDCTLYNVVAKPILLDPYGNDLDNDIREAIWSKMKRYSF